MYSVLLVEDEDSTQERLAQVIEAHPDLELIEKNAMEAEAKACIAHVQPDVLRPIRQSVISTGFVK